VTSTATLAPPLAPTVAAADPEVRTAANLRSFSGVMVAGAVALPVLPAVGPLCPLRRTTGVPCPLCGMTTGVTALARGDLVGAVAANPLAPVLVLVVLLAWAVLLAGRDRLPVRSRTLGRGLSIALPGLWLFQLHRYDII
jgi:hypothetical protein